MIKRSESLDNIPDPIRILRLTHLKRPGHNYHQTNQFITNAALNETIMQLTICTLTSKKVTITKSTSNVTSHNQAQQHTEQKHFHLPIIGDVNQVTSYKVATSNDLATFFSESVNKLIQCCSYLMLIRGINYGMEMMDSSANRGLTRQPLLAAEQSLALETCSTPARFACYFFIPIFFFTNSVFSLCNVPHVGVMSIHLLETAFNCLFLLQFKLNQEEIHWWKF